MTNHPTDPLYLTSHETKKVLCVTDCHLAHLRNEGKLPFVKKGNAFMYEITGLELTKSKFKEEHA